MPTRGISRSSIPAHRMCVALLLAALLTNGAHAQVSVRVGDVAHFKGPRVNRLQGLGLVVGLAGTGDGGDYRRMVEPLANWLEHYANPVNDLKELKDTKNVAVVSVTAELPEGGIRGFEQFRKLSGRPGRGQSMAMSRPPGTQGDEGGPQVGAAEADVSGQGVVGGHDCAPAPSGVTTVTPPVPSVATTTFPSPSTARSRTAQTPSAASRRPAMQSMRR